jgi:hypothetical protein
MLAAPFSPFLAYRGITANILSISGQSLRKPKDRSKFATVVKPTLWLRISSAKQYISIRLISLFEELRGLQFSENVA